METNPNIKYKARLTGERRSMVVKETQSRISADNMFVLYSLRRMLSCDFEGLGHSKAITRGCSVVQNRSIVSFCFNAPCIVRWLSAGGYELSKGTPLLLRIVGMQVD